MRKIIPFMAAAMLIPVAAYAQTSNGGSAPGTMSGTANGATSGNMGG